MRARTRLPATVWALGLVSLLTDLGSEMIVPLLPVLLASVGGSMQQLGLLQGLGEFVLAGLKFASGWWSDRQRAKKPWIVAGYGLSALVRPLFALVQAPWQAVVVRSVDRIGKGLRSAPRDALLADSVAAAQRGAAYGVQRAMDHAGAVGGALLGWALLGAGCELRTVFAWALVPGLLAVIVLIGWVRDPDRATIAARTPDPPRALRRLLPFLAVVALGTIATSVDLFLVARAGELGLPPTQQLLLWAVLHLVRATLASAFGSLSDRIGRRGVLALGLAAHAVVMLLFAGARSAAWMWPLFALHGLHAAITEGAERGFVADLTGAGKRGTVFGIYHAVQGVAGLAGPLLLGGVWDLAGATDAFLVAAAAALLALVALFGVGRSPGSAP
jgi:MFS family permease